MYMRPAKPGNEAPIVVDGFQSATLVLGILLGFLSGLL